MGKEYRILAVRGLFFGLGLLFVTALGWIFMGRIQQLDHCSYGTNDNKEDGCQGSTQSTNSYIIRNPRHNHYTDVATQTTLNTERASFTGVTQSTQTIRKPRILNFESQDQIQQHVIEDSSTFRRNLEPLVYHKLQAGESYPAGLGSPNPDVAVNNPLKGLIGSPRWNAQDHSGLNSSLDFYYVGLDEVMFGNPDIVGPEAAFNWSVTDAILEESASRYKHVVWRIFIHYPGQELKLPDYLVDAVELVSYAPEDRPDELSPHYGDPILLEAIEQFIKAFGKQYDGDKRLAFIQMGLLGFWGEWHTYPVQDLIPEDVKDRLISWYSQAFSTTRLQTRYPRKNAYNIGIGLHDDSFAFSTLDGINNGNDIENDFFWPRVLREGVENFWRTSVMGGETRPELQSYIFDADYPAGSSYNQDFDTCVEITHATYMLHNKAFIEPLPEGDELKTALSSHARMGYNFYVSEVSVAVDRNIPSMDSVNIYVTITQAGNAPFYYPLSLRLSCPDMPLELDEEGVNNIIEMSDKKTFSFTDVSASLLCLKNVNLSLYSPYMYRERPIKFAQDGVDPARGSLSLELPIPSSKESESPRIGVIIGFTLMDVGFADSFSAASTPLGPLEEGDIIDLDFIGDRLSVRCEVSDNTLTTVERVVFNWDGQSNEETEGPPWAMNGRIGNNFFSVDYLTFSGTKTVSAAAFGVGDLLIGSLEVTFEIIAPETSAPATVPPATVPPATVPPATVPPATVPPATVPTATVTPATVPPATVPPATVPPTTKVPDTPTVPPITGVAPPTSAPTILAPTTSPTEATNEPTGRQTAHPTTVPTKGQDVPGESAILGFTLMNTGFMYDFPIGELRDGDTVVVSPNDSDFSIRCETTDAVELVMFHWNGRSHLERNRPWAMDGKEGNFLNSVPYLASAGEKKVMAAAFSPDRKIIGTLTISFTVVSKNTPSPTTPPVPPPEPLSVFKYYDSIQDDSTSQLPNDQIAGFPPKLTNYGSKESPGSSGNRPRNIFYRMFLNGFRNRNNPSLRNDPPRRYRKRNPK